MEKIIIVNNWIKDGYNLHCEGLWLFGEFGFFPTRSVFSICPSSHRFANSEHSHLT